MVVKCTSRSENSDAAQVENASSAAFEAIMADVEKRRRRWRWALLLPLLFVVAAGVALTAHWPGWPALLVLAVLAYAYRVVTWRH